ncbi:MAG: hypothetical protein L0332_00855 [Chloroflexi bacterium]|nr:hypothetical protein [Chloroflexota bacterium]MCI0574695.1 hypothetical protein [Chloroflexota bacterium]MCI0647412.1 hypothetical protein [Chloroflexota bacterium]MCI0725271.1 hypothetical protein [Chloroflexota bacterium]
MTYFEAEAHSFVVRLWRENPDNSDEPGEWRGWLEHVQSGQRHYFRAVTDISRIVATYLGEADELAGQVFMPIQAEDDKE